MNDERSLKDSRREDLFDLLCGSVDEREQEETLPPLLQAWKTLIENTPEGFRDRLVKDYRERLHGSGTETALYQYAYKLVVTCSDGRSIHSPELLKMPEKLCQYLVELKVGPLEKVGPGRTCSACGYPAPVRYRLGGSTQEKIFPNCLNCGAKLD